MKNEAFGYKVKINSRCIHSEREPEDYGAWSAAYDNSIDSLVRKTTEYPDIVSSLDIPSGSNAIVVWVEWSSGDSFGRGDRSDTEVVGIFTDIGAADSLKAHILEQNKLEANEVDFTSSDGQRFKMSWVPWGGYFEVLDSVNIDVVKVFWRVKK